MNELDGPLSEAQPESKSQKVKNKIQKPNKKIPAVVAGGAAALLLLHLPGNMNPCSACIAAQTQAQSTKHKHE